MGDARQVLSFVWHHPVVALWFACAQADLSFAVARIVTT